MRLAYDIYQPPGDVEQNLPPVILLHGMMDSRKTWKYLAPKISKLTGRTVYAVDARNHGESPWSDEITFDIIADDVDNFLTQHNIRKAVLVGHSMGGRTAATLALKRPEKVEKIVVEDMNLRNFRPVDSGAILNLLNILQEVIKEIPSGVDEQTARQTIVDFLRPLLAGGYKGKVENYDLSMIPLKKTNGSFAWQTNLKALKNFLTTEKIQQILNGVYLGDALFIYGTKSFFKVDKDPRIPKYFPHSTRLGFQGATHLVHFERPGKFVKEVSNFINNYSMVKSKY